jgi:hypothetical protein
MSMCSMVVNGGSPTQKPLAEQGDAKGQHNLGVLYERPWGVPENTEEAARWSVRPLSSALGRRRLISHKTILKVLSKKSKKKMTTEQ